MILLGVLANRFPDKVPSRHSPTLTYGFSIDLVLKNNPQGDLRKYLFPCFSICSFIFLSFMVSVVLHFSICQAFKPLYPLPVVAMRCSVALAPLWREKSLWLQAGASDMKSRREVTLGHCLSCFFILNGLFLRAKQIQVVRNLRNFLMFEYFLRFVLQVFFRFESTYALPLRFDSEWMFFYSSAAFFEAWPWRSRRLKSAMENGRKRGKNSWFCLRML